MGEIYGSSMPFGYMFVQLTTLSRNLLFGWGGRSRAEASPKTLDAIHCNLTEYKHGM